jgi:hypothetical protein
VDSQDVILVIETETYEGKARQKVRWVNSPSMQLKDQLSAEDAKSFAARMRGKIVAMGGAGAQKKKATDNDDIPF